MLWRVTWWTELPRECNDTPIATALLSPQLECLWQGRLARWTRPGSDLDEPSRQAANATLPAARPADKTDRNGQATRHWEGKFGSARSRAGWALLSHLIDGASRAGNKTEECDQQKGDQAHPGLKMNGVGYGADAPPMKDCLTDECPRIGD